MSITGQGAANTEVNGGAAGSVFTVESDGKVTLQGLLITNGLASSGDTGGGIYNEGNLTVSESAIHSNGRGGFANWDEGTATISNSSISDNNETGGIGNRGNLFINNSTISGNTGGLRGGGIWSFGKLVIENSTIIDNSCTGEGGGIHNEFGTVMLGNSTISGNSAQFGGGISLFGGTVAIDNSTISGNSASMGGGIHNLGSITITSSTISGNSADNSAGGISNGGGVHLSNSMVVNSQNGTDCAGSKAIASLGYSLDSDNTCNLTATGDLPNRDPLLGPLQDNGGATFTHALLGGSPAIDAGSCSGAVADQRGHVRPADMPDIPNVDDACDIGAFELQPASTDFSVFLPVVMRKQ